MAQVVLCKRNLCFTLRGPGSRNLIQLYAGDTTILQDERAEQYQKAGWVTILHPDLDSMEKNTPKPNTVNKMVRKTKKTKK